MNDRAATLATPPAPRRRALAGLAALLLVLAAVACLFMAWQARQQQAALALPSRLVPLTDGAVWLVMDKRLWLIGRDGAVTSRLTADEAGLSSLPLAWARLDPPRTTSEDVNMDELTAEGEPVPHVGPTQIVALLAGTRQAHVLGARTGRLQHRIVLQWPADLKDAAAEPTALAVHPDGRMAIALGPVGLVAVFGPQGQLIARSAPGTYAPSKIPTQGLWWDGETLWSTDAERNSLVRLKGSDLSVASRLALPADGQQASHTTIAQAHPNAGTEVISPLATLVRLDRDLSEGRVTHVWADGLEKDENLGDGARPGGLAWLGDTLLVAENRDIRLRRFDSDRLPLADLGDQSVTQTLAQLRTARDQWIHRMLGWLGGAIACGLSGLSLLAWLAWRSGAAKQAAIGSGGVVPNEASLFDLPDDVTAAGAPSAAAPARVNSSSAERIPAKPSAAQPASSAPAPAPAPSGPAPAIALPGWYPTLGDSALQASAWTQHRQDANERLRETFEMVGGPGKRWIVLTNRRLLTFNPAASGQGWQLDKDWHRSDIATIALLPREKLSWTQKRQLPSNDGAWLRLKTREGQSLEGFVQPMATAERIHAIVSLTARPPDAA